MGKRRTKNESFNNLQNVVDAKNPSVVGQMDIVMADAVQTSVKNEEHLQEVATKLKKDAEVVTPDTPKEEPTSVKNEFTAKLVLDESMRDFSIKEDVPDATKKVDGRSNRVMDDDGTDTYLDYDMFDFIYGLVTDCWPKPLNPINDMKHRKFMYIGSDNYSSRPVDAVGSPEDMSGEDVPAFDLHSQVSVSGDKIILYANEDRGEDESGEKTKKLGTVSAFDWIRAVCDLYKFKYSGPTPRRSSNSHWEYSLTIQVPCESGYPMMVEDYFETLNLTIEDVMDKDFATKYRKAQAKERKEAQEYLDAMEIKKKVNNAITAAAQDNTEPLEVHLKKLFAELTAAGLKYSRKKIKQEFMDAFDDDDEDIDESLNSETHD